MSGREEELTELSSDRSLMASFNQTALLFFMLCFDIKIAIALIKSN